ncbi:MAG: HD domain-containing protein [Flavobacteriales bacterium Tduv]
MNVNLTKVNDPIYGLISVPEPILVELIAHPYFQRLRYIAQTGLSHIVYPGACHTRFHHALGCLHLMQKAIEVLRANGVNISKDEERGAYIAILLHDIGHGPFSHVLEKSIVTESVHEDISRILMADLNKTFYGALDPALDFFESKHPKKFLCQLISSQLDVDRMDYLQRDSFYTGVAEGSINSDRLISMFNVVDDKLVVEVKALHSVENFLIARMFMYWQVYLHKTGVGAELLLIKIFNRAKELIRDGVELYASRSLLYFLEKNEKIKRWESFKNENMHHFVQLDDTDVWQAVKAWQFSKDKILSILCKMIVNRDLWSVKILDAPFPEGTLEVYKEQVKRLLKIDRVEYFVHQTKIEKLTYHPNKNPIQLLTKSGQVVDLLKVSQVLDNKKITSPISKYYFCHLKEKTGLL